MDEFCGSSFWLHNLTWNITSQPDLTPCFQETVLIWVPCLVLWLFAPIEVLYIFKSHRRYIPVTLLNLFKSFLSTVLCILSLIELIQAFSPSEEVSPLVNFVTPIIKSLTYSLVFGLNYFYRYRGVNNSSLMLLFWVLMSVASLINLRSILRSTILNHDTETLADWHLSELKLTLRIVSTPIVIVQLVLACIADRKAQDPFIVTGEDYRRRSPEVDASVLSRITFWWLNSFMWLGYKRALTQDDLYAVKPSDKTEAVSQRFDALLEPVIQKALREKRNDTFIPFHAPSTNKSTAEVPFLNKQSNREENKNGRADTNAHEDEEPSKYVNLFPTVLRAFWPDLLLASIFKLVSTLMTVASPMLLDAIISFVTSNEPAWRGGLYASLLFSVSILESLTSNREQYITNVNVMRIRTCLTSTVYRKTIRLSNQGRKHFTSGQIVNFMSTDTQRVADLVQNINQLWSAPILITLSMVLLYQKLGVAIFAGLGVMLINIPFNGYVALILRTLQLTAMRFKDKRIKLLTEIFNGIKIIKIHAWEDPYKKRVENVRAQEIRCLKRQCYYSSVITFAFTCLPFIVALASFATYVLIDSNNTLDANKVFVSLSLFNIIRIPLAILPMLITNVSMFLVAIRRLNRFLEADEVNDDSIKQIDDDSSAIKIKDASFRWDTNGELTLQDINLSIPKRKLVAIVGPVGSGKSSLLSAILNDIERVHGDVMVDLNSSMAYVPQESWILNTTLKNNIMFNKVVNEEKYQKIIDACALGPDLKTLEMGDQSEIGEKGINLSGGQKQRVSLARAVYADTDIYLLDDPMNAVDAYVGRHIFDNILGPKGMLRDRTRVLVTNKLSVLPEVDYILVLKDGKLTEAGTYEQLLKNRGELSHLLVKYLLDNSKEKLTLSEGARADLITKELERLETRMRSKSFEESSTADPESDSKRSPIKQEQHARPAAKSMDSSGPNRGNLTTQEISQVGSVGLEVHLNFIRTMGINFVIAVVVHVASAVFTLSSNVWLSEWSNDALNETIKNDTKQRDLRLGVYAGLGMGESTCVIVSTILLNLACLRGSQLLHNRMLARVLRAPMSWFHTTPSGRIMNRFSKDIDTIDLTIRFNVRILMVIALRSVTSLILISMGSVYSIIFIIPIVLLYFLFQIFYVSTSRQLKRIESATKSPIYSHFSETIMGTSSIRAFKVTQEFILESNHRVDVNNASYYISFVASRWLALRLEFLGFIVVLVASMVAVLSRGLISPGIAGLSVTYSLTVTTVLSFLVRTYSDYETNVVSVERLLEYTRLPNEPEDEEVPSNPNWPDKGAITFTNFSTRYRPELELVLRDFSLNINPSERIGLVGRTGAGKSSVTLALFRILEPADGCIVIDEVNISHINLKVLRSKISIIPQEPIMFTGTIRQNIDPTESYLDDEIWRAIELSHLGPFIRSLPLGLEHDVQEGGSNFSVGQKQLFCLARTLLRRSKILVLDEATAALDLETDNLIQKTIREEFKDTTIVTIAHRLETIQDYDRIVVMESGVAVEQGKPSELIKKTNSIYHQLAKDDGLTRRRKS